MKTAQLDISMSIDIFRRLAWSFAVLFAVHAGAQDYPNKTIRIVVPFPPGGATDVVTRIVAQKLTDQFGRQVVAENRGGAGGILGSETVAKAAPDGYTLVMGTTGTHAINASLYPKLSYDPVRDFAPVTRTALLPNMIVAHPSVPAKSVRELIALAKKRPGELTYASSGSALYLSGALFTSMAGIELIHVPYKGGGQAMPALLGGEVALSFATVVSSLPHVKTGGGGGGPPPPPRRPHRSMRPSPSLACLVTKPSPGTACWHRRQHRAKSSRGSTPKSCARSNCPKCSSCCSRKAPRR